METTNTDKGNVPVQAQPGLDVNALNKRHLQRSDKFFRMYAGAASTFTEFHGKFIHLDIRIDDRLRIPLETITRNIADSWLTEKELSAATAYCASIFKSARWSGFFLAGTDIDSQQKREEAVRRMKEPSDEPDVFIRMIEEPYGSADSPESPFPCPLP